ncbi:ABC transporter permease [Ketogulonicigenium vulgare]|uniref:ABC-type dipeptide/oligopeptide/nickel transport system, permease component n=1 Tax=Ketogulonicigenium vulgare (strain WSH-001) TaxID=759362 RepID=F9Y5L4_KETVW|nr:ABC transporter permease [Ketogulonicigenium vulgare]ADO42572.1 binding-protein-dependent transport systems inner membrane component [Ketogulonicigenium vulgare Y25]AEM40767.1 ABC-type dipeptide/oligopeptide/nickel transport system, permease component [Ketogulonicigenium vulgare WSH-001]ALJ80935.1 diguanylate cyclase [Ketogulonicigenium vulgare]ANW33706.1 diguanylate cyclase [Ketogulonicigenium vulgare]AOZ54485.1 binding-protein-dependent transporters inner membrane component [Ketogulonicig
MTDTQTTPPARRSNLMRVLRWSGRNANVVVGGALVLLIVLVAIFAPLLTPHDPSAQNLMNMLKGPSPQHPFGTDDFGRDIFARVVYGARLSLAEVAVSVGIATIVGVPLGIIAGMAGKWMDEFIMWFMDVLFAFPGIVLAILVVSILGSSLFNMMIAIALFAIPIYARLARNLTLGLKKMEFIEAAQALGVPQWRILVNYILRNSIGPMIVQSTLTAGTVILAAASLSFLGLGAQPPLPEWGAMMSNGRNYFGVNIWMSLFPGIAIMITVLGFNILGDGLRDLLDPRK